MLGKGTLSVEDANTTGAWLGRWTEGGASEKELVPSLFVFDLMLLASS